MNKLVGFVKKTNVDREGKRFCSSREIKIGIGNMPQTKKQVDSIKLHA